MKTLIGNHANDALQDVDVILYFDELDLIDEDCFQYLLKYVSEERIAYAQKYKKREDRILSIMAYIILRVGLFNVFGISERPQLFKKNCGKPYLKDYPNINVSISHCVRGVACAFSIQSNNVGIDIQDIVKCDCKMAQYFMNKTEYDILTRTYDKDRYFTRVWTLKESYGKYQETGIGYNMRETDVVMEMILKELSVSSYNLPEFIITAVASVPLKLRRVQITDIIKFCEEH